jgi:hypothetical protein
MRDQANTAVARIVKVSIMTWIMTIYGQIRILEAPLHDASASSSGMKLNGKRGKGSPENLS